MSIQQPTITECQSIKCNGCNETLEDIKDYKMDMWQNVVICSKCGFENKFEVASHCPTIGESILVATRL